MDQPLVSIALCTYNGERFLREQLDSLVRQTYPNLEIIAVDDCSIDKTIEILEEYAERYSFIKVYQNESNLGFVKNFDKAIGLCSGDFVALCDQDDIWNLNKIEMQVAAIGDNIFVYHDSEFITADGAPMNKKMSDIFNMYAGDDPLIFLLFNCISGHSILMHKALTNYIIPLPANLFHDRWIAYIAANIGTIGYIDTCLIRYRQHEKSHTNILKMSWQEQKQRIRLGSVQRFYQDLNWLQHFKNFALTSSHY